MCGFHTVHEFSFQELGGRMLQLSGKFRPPMQAVPSLVSLAQKKITPIAQGLGFTQLRTFLVGEVGHVMRPSPDRS